MSLYSARILVGMVPLALVWGCRGGGAGTEERGGADASTPDGGAVDSGPPGPVDGGFFDAGPPTRTQRAELWYSVDGLLVRVALDRSDGSVMTLQTHRLQGDLPAGFNAITMLKDGTLLGARLATADEKTYYYHVPVIPDGDADVIPVELGVMPDDLMIEALYSDCEGRVYAMDTGRDDGDAVGNRLLRFTGNVLASDFTYVVVSDLSVADVADIDDMSPGISDNEISDNPGFAIDSGSIHAFNYESGTGTPVGRGGTWGIHALGGPLFDDGVSRLYVLSQTAELYRVDPNSFSLSPVLATGPVPAGGVAGWSGLTGPLTSCVTGFVLF